jgi:hypothetical protein
MMLTTAMMMMMSACCIPGVADAVDDASSFGLLLDGDML